MLGNLLQNHLDFSCLNETLNVGEGLHRKQDVFDQYVRHLCACLKAATADLIGRPEAAVLLLLAVSCLRSFV